MTPSMPPQGQMVLYSSATPPLDDGSYRITVSTNVSTTRAGRRPPGPLSQQHYFDVVGPQFSVPHVDGRHAACRRATAWRFQDDLPHIVLSRRTLPWERELYPRPDPGDAARPTDAPALAIAIPGSPCWYSRKANTPFCGTSRCSKRSRPMSSPARQTDRHHLRRGGGGRRTWLPRSCRRSRNCSFWCMCAGSIPTTRN